MFKRHRVLVPGGIVVVVAVALLLGWTFGATTNGPASETGAQLALARALYTAIGEGTLRVC